MRIALVIDRMDPARGGRETSTAEIAQRLADVGCRTTVYCTAAAWESPGVLVTPLGVRGPSRLIQFRNFTHDVIRVARERCEDVVHATFPLPGADVYQLRSGTIQAQREAALRRRGQVGRAIARAINPLNPRRAYLAHLEQKVFSDARAWLLPVSQMVAREILAVCPGRTRVRVVHNAVGPPNGEAESRWVRRAELRDRYGVSADEPVFLTIATNFELKGVAELIRAFAAWRRRRGASGGRLWIVGRGRPTRYMRLAARLGQVSTVQFFPATRDVFSRYAAADACVLLSWYDPCSRVVLEAMRMGLPSITTSQNGAADLLSGGAGVVVPTPRDQAAIVEALEQVVEPGARAAMQNACRMVESRISVETHVDALLEVYEQIVREKGTRRRLDTAYRRGRPVTDATGGGSPPWRKAI